MTDRPIELVLLNPLFAVAATVLAWSMAVGAYRALGSPALLHPVLTATAAMSLVLAAAGMPYETYFRQAFPLHAALGVVIVLLAVPLYRQFSLIREARTAIAVSLLAGSTVAFVTALALPMMAQAPAHLLATLAPKSTTTAVAVQIAEGLGGVPALTALAVISTGVFGAAFGPPILSAAGVRDHRAIGLALGVASHAIGTARAFQISDTAGAFSTLGMILNALLTVALAPIILGAL
jgi:putative effector of murein hydrolase